MKAHDVRSFHPGQVSAAIRLVCETPWSEASGFGPPQKEAFLEAATHAHGRAALCLSGGGAVALAFEGAVLVCMVRTPGAGLGLGLELGYP